MNPLREEVAESDLSEHVRHGLIALIDRYGFETRDQLHGWASVNGSGAKGEVAWLILLTLQTAADLKRTRGT